MPEYKPNKRINLIYYCFFLLGLLFFVFVYREAHSSLAPNCVSDLRSVYEIDLQYNFPAKYSNFKSITPSYCDCDSDCDCDDKID